MFWWCSEFKWYQTECQESKECWLRESDSTGFFKSLFLESDSYSWESLGTQPWLGLQAEVLKALGSVKIRVLISWCFSKIGFPFIPYLFSFTLLGIIYTLDINQFPWSPWMNAAVFMDVWSMKCGWQGKESSFFFIHISPLVWISFPFRTWKRPKCPEEWIKKMWYTHTHTHTHTHICKGILLSHIKWQIVPSAETWVDLVSLIQNGVRKRKTNIILTHICAI